MSIVCWSGDLDRVWPVLILSTTGAASGLEVNVFFTFWGLRVLQRNDKRFTGQNWMQKGESVVDHGGTDHLKLGKIHFAGAGTMMIKMLAKQYNVASPTELLDMAKDLGVNLYPCQMTMDLYGLHQGRLHRRSAAAARRRQLHRHGRRLGHHAFHLTDRQQTR